MSRYTEAVTYPDGKPLDVHRCIAVVARRQCKRHTVTGVRKAMHGRLASLEVAQHFCWQHARGAYPLTDGTFGGEAMIPRGEESDDAHEHHT